MDAMPRISLEYHTPQQVYDRGCQLEGMTFRDVLDLGIVLGSIAFAFLNEG